jgi:hypothetical protein
MAPTTPAPSGTGKTAANPSETTHGAKATTNPSETTHGAKATTKPAESSHVAETTAKSPVTSKTVTPRQCVRWHSD